MEGKCIQNDNNKKYRRKKMSEDEKDYIQIRFDYRILFYEVKMKIIFMRNLNIISQK